MEAIAIGVALTLISAAILAAVAWLWRYRSIIAAGARKRSCRHEWEPLPDNLISIGDTEWCVKCDARR